MSIFNRLKNATIGFNRGLLGLSTIIAHTCLTIRKRADEFSEWEPPIRIVKDKVVTTEFVDFIVDQLQTETSEFGDFKYHQCGLGVTAENVTDSGIETDTGISPATGTQTETDHDTYKSVATMTMDATEAITEHVIMSQSGAGTCMDRTVFSAINVVSGNQIEFTFEISFTAGG
uniref:Uncharacterized protein n=1 Tax=viral metagenome TaxID=1070528 RepID=A0A6M3LKJ8_9ZZZZ